MTLPERQSRGASGSERGDVTAPGSQWPLTGSFTRPEVVSAEPEDQFKPSVLLGRFYTRILCERDLGRVIPRVDRRPRREVKSSARPNRAGRPG